MVYLLRSLQHKVEIMLRNWARHSDQSRTLGDRDSQRSGVRFCQPKALGELVIYGSLTSCTFLGQPDIRVGSWKYVIAFNLSIPYCTSVPDPLTATPGRRPDEAFTML